MPYATSNALRAATEPSPYALTLQEAEGPKLYNAIKAGAAHGACALCGLPQASQVDQYAPKADFPLLALTPLHFSPVCGPCNQGKSNKLATLNSREAFHTTSTISEPTGGSTPA